MDDQQFLDFINYIKHNKQIVVLEDLKNKFKEFIETYDLNDDLELIIQIIEIDETIEPDTLLNIILNLKNKITKTIAVPDNSKEDKFLYNKFINEYFTIKFLPKNIILRYNKNENLINIDDTYTNEMGKKYIINFKEYVFNDYNNKIELIAINSNNNGFRIDGFVLMNILDTNVFYNIRETYYGDVEVFLKNNSIFIELSDENSLSDIIKHFENSFKKKYKNNFYELIKFSKLYTSNKKLFELFKQFVLLFKTKYNENLYENEKIAIRDANSNDNLTILKCEHEKKLNRFINTNNPNIDILNDFLNDEVTIIGSMIFCKWCNSKISYLNFEELLDDKLILINYEIFKLEPYVNYINLKIYLEEFIYNFLNIFKNDYYDYITILAISIINWLNILSINRLKYEAEYANDIKNDYMFFSRLTQEFFSFNIREDVSYLNKRILFTNIYLVFHLLIELSLNDFWYLVNDNFKSNQKHFNDFIFYMISVFIKKLDIALESHTQPNLFVKRVIEIIIDLLPPTIRNNYITRCNDYLKIIFDIKSQKNTNYTKNVLRKKIFSIDENLYNININVENNLSLKLKEKKMIKMTNKFSRKDETEYIYLSVDKMFYNESVFSSIISLYNELTFFYKHNNNEIYEVDVIKLNNQYCVYDKTNYKEKKLFIMLKDPKYLNLTYKMKSISDMFLFFNINNKFIFLKEYNIEESNFIINSFLLNLEIIINKKIIINDVIYPLSLNEMVNFFFNVYDKLCTLKLLNDNNIKTYINILNSIFSKNGNPNS